MLKRSFDSLLNNDFGRLFIFAMCVLNTNWSALGFAEFVPNIVKHKENQTENRMDHNFHALLISCTTQGKFLSLRVMHSNRIYSLINSKCVVCPMNCLVLAKHKTPTNKTPCFILGVHIWKQTQTKTWHTHTHTCGTDAVLLSCLTSFRTTVNVSKRLQLINRMCEDASCCVERIAKSYPLSGWRQWID